MIRQNYGQDKYYIFRGLVTCFSFLLCVYFFIPKNLINIIKKYFDLVIKKKEKVNKFINCKIFYKGLLVILQIFKVLSWLFKFIEQMINLKLLDILDLIYV